MYRPRLIETLLQSALRTFPAVMITGARQCGKTTLLRQMLPHHSYALLDDVNVRLLARRDPVIFFERFKPPVLIDEIQHAPELLSQIKSLIDADRSAGRFVITGSQQFAVMKNVSESLAGRVAVLKLHPYSLSELHRHKQTRSLLDYLNVLPKTVPSRPHASLGETILKGLYPEINENKQVDAALWYSSYVQTYLDRDVRGSIRDSNLNDFERFVKLLAARTSQELNQASLSRELGLSIPTVRTWLSFLEASSLVYLLPPFHNNFGKRITKSPKIFFMDTGLVCYLVGLQTVEHVLQSPMAGALFETLIVSHFKKTSDFLGVNNPLYFWKAKSGPEVDLLIDIAGVLHPIEIKLSATLTPHHYAALGTWRSLSKSQMPGLVISQSPHRGRIAAHVHGCHWSDL